MENPMETRGFRQGIEIQLEDVWDFPPGNSGIVEKYGKVWKSMEN